MLAPFNPSADQTIEIAIDLLQLNQNDILYDLGCGDGRLLFAASSKVHRCVGVEVDETFVLRARKENVYSNVDIRHEDATQVDWTDATKLYLYLVPKGIQFLLPKLEKARDRGVRIVTNVFSIPQWEAKQVLEHKSTKIYLYY